MKRYFSRVGAGVLLLGGLAAPLQGQRAERRIGVPAGATITIVNQSGSIEVTGENREDISVSTISSDVRRELTIKIDGRQINVSVSTTELEVRVPSNVRLNVRNESGSVEVTNVRAPLDIETQSGSIEITGTPETLHAESLSGSIEAPGALESTYAESVSGSVTLSAASGVVEAKSTSGSVEVHGRNLKDTRISSVSGSVEFYGTFARDGRLEAEASSGHIELHLPANFPAEYDLSAISGHIENEFGPRAARSHDGSGERLKFVNAGGGGRVVATTVSGSISLQRH